MKLADLKRLQPGTRLRIVRCLIGDVAPEKQWRTVRQVRSADLVVEPDAKPGTMSYLQFPKARDFEPTEGGFRVYETDDARGTRIIAAEYSFT